MPVPIHGKEYYTVAERIKTFRDQPGSSSIVTELISDGDRVIVKASIIECGNVISTGYAEEERGSTNINKTSALENAETSAVGRALAFFGLAGTEIASADEVANAIQQQAEKAVYEKVNRTVKAILDNSESVTAIKTSLANDELSRASEAWFELTEEDKAALWVAPSKGGPFTTKEREIMKSAEFRQAYYGQEAS